MSVTETRPTEARKADRRERLSRNQSIFIAYGLAIVLWGITSSLASGFATWDHTKTLLTEACFVGVVAAGQTFVIITGGVDLSAPWMLNSAATLVTVWTHGQDGSLVWVIPLVLVGAAGVGLVNGIGITVLGVQPIIMTLGVNGVLEGGLLLITNGGQSPNVPHTLAYISTKTAAGVPIVLLIWVVLAIVAWVLLAKTPFGRKLYAIGTNVTVARLSGVRTNLVTISAYVISALCSAIAGLLLVGYIGQAYLGMGDSYLFTSIAAVIIGGASILGGSGNYFGTIAGALILTILTALLPILNLNPAALQVVYGGVILITVLLASVRIGGGRD
jgi:ribose transport system permease protein